MRAPGERFAWIAVALIAFVPVLASAAHHRAFPRLVSGEAFAAFACAGAAARAGADPYASEPLGTCEARLHVIPPNVVEPAPLPPPTLGVFALLSLLPYPLASAVWGALLVASVAAAAVGSCALAPRVPAVAVWTALLPGLLVFDGYYGETPALVAAALVLGAWALRRGSIAGAAAGVTIAALFEPHVGAAAWLALFAGERRARAPLAAVLALLVLGTWVAPGHGELVRYLTVVLPAHARSELPANDQYSLTSLLFAFGVPAGAALAAGALSYALALAAGIALGPAVARRLGAPEFAVLLPAGFVLLGGTFIHGLQMGLAVPLGVVVANATPGPRRALALVTMLVGALPEPATGIVVLGFGAAAAFAAAWGAAAVADSAGGRVLRALACGAAGACAYAGFAALVHAAGRSAASAALPAFPVPAPHELAEIPWTTYVSAVSHPPTAGEFLARGTVWTMLLATFALAASARRAVPTGDSNTPFAGRPVPGGPR
jgi:hypothetical protein